MFKWTLVCSGEVEFKWETSIFKPEQNTEDSISDKHIVQYMLKVSDNECFVCLEVFLFCRIKISICIPEM